jgi:hypothetical protein
MHRFMVRGGKNMMNNLIFTSTHLPSPVASTRYALKSLADFQDKGPQKCTHG